MLGYPSYGSRREYSSRGAKRYDSSDIAWAWASQQSENGRCPAAMTFTDGRFYSYATCIAERIEHEGETVFLVNEGRYSVTTSQHQSRVHRAVHGRGKVFAVPEVPTGTDSLADLPGTLECWRHEVEMKLAEADRAKREVKRSRHIGEAFEVWEKMVEFAEFFKLDLTDFVVKFPVPAQIVVGEQVYTRIVALRLGVDPSPWTRKPVAPPIESILRTTIEHTAAAQQAAA